MGEIVYKGPNSQRIVNPKVNDLVDIVTKSDDRYWMYGTGDALISFTDGAGWRRLILKRFRPYGVKLGWTEQSDPTLFVSFEEKDEVEMVPIECGGEVYEEPSTLFVSENQAIQAIADFCEDGRKSALVKWKDWNEILNQLDA